MFPGQQFILFCLVGVTTTLVDFGVFNLLTRPRPGWGRIPANIVSVSVAMAWAFLANWLLVFRPEGHDWLGRAGRFLLTTGFSAFVLQNLVLYLTSRLWKAPGRAAWQLARAFRLDRRFSEDMVNRNTCKLLAVITGLVWNFLFYKFFVYAT